METDSYYAHGPIAALAFILLCFVNLRSIKKQPSKPAIPVMLLCLFVLATFYFQVQRIHFGEYLGLSAIAACGIALFWGVESLQRLRWAFWFLFLALPVPSFWLVHLSFYLRQVAVVLVVAVMKLTPLVIRQDGNVIQYGSHWVRVADACSGLRTLITVVAMCSGLAFFESSARKRVLYFSLAVPIAILGNTLRILLMALGMGAGYEKQTLGSWHEAIGWLALALVIGAIFFIVGKIPEEKMKHQDERDVVIVPMPRPVPRWAPLFLIFIFASAAGLKLSESKAATVDAVTTHLEGERSFISHWIGTDLGQPEEVYRILGTNDLRYRAFRRARSKMKLYYFEMNSPVNQSATHPPEISLISEGYEVAESKPILFGKWQARRSLFKGKRNDLLVVHWFAVNGYRTDSYLAHQARSLFELLRGRQLHSSMRKVSIEIPHSEKRTKEADEEIRRFVEALAL